MVARVALISGGAAVGKTALARHLLPVLGRSERLCFVKIDCLQTADDTLIRGMGIPSAAGLSEDTCPDHFLASNMPELLAWAEEEKGSLLLVETAGLCHRCCPATEKTVNICAVDCSVSVRSPGKLGPMLTTADMIVLSKIDLVSQAEREIISATIAGLNPRARIFPVDGLCGYGVELLARAILATPPVADFEGDLLRYSMPAGVCSYCVGEQRIGREFQQGVVRKIRFEGSVGA
jgi:Ni2+-binding GTPase involved in maturation of urease and hydrogenase